MAHHLTERGTFKSGKYPWCPEGWFVMKDLDLTALVVIRVYPWLAWQAKRPGWCKPEFIALDFSDPFNRAAIALYADRTEDATLAQDLKTAVRRAREPQPNGHA